MRMSAAANVGRVGGLAVALGIGVAVVSGAGAASADPSAGSGSDSSSTSSSSAKDTSAKETSADPSTESAESTESTEPLASSAELSTASATSDDLETVEAETLEQSMHVDTDDVSPPASKKRASTSHRQRASTADPIAESSDALSSATDATPTKHAEAAAPSTAIDEPQVSDTASTADVVAASAVETSGVATAQQPVETAATAQPPVETAVSAPQGPAEVSTALSSVASALFSPFDGDAPSAPMESAAMWTLAAAARRESLTTTPNPDQVVNPVTNSLTTGAALAAAADPAVVAIERTPPLAWLQQLPIIGPVIVTPIVAFIHQIPILSDILHPWIGYPVQRGLPLGSPVARDVKVVSFDGTRIYTHFMPALGLQAGQTAPTILNGPGLSLPGATNLVSSPLADVINGVITDFVGQMGIGALRQAGYNVVTWDPRGEWNSGGRLELNSPDFEARDVSAIISWLATQPEVKLDDPETLDPRIGMVGVSYGGGIQTVTAATDHRVDAIVPTITWNTLNSTLYKAEAFKSSWGTLLSGALIATLARVNPRIYPAAVYGALTGQITPSDQQLLTDRGPGGPTDLVNNITAPTLLIQGTVDTIFSLQESDATAQTLIANGVPTKVLWFCGGHGVCLNNLFDQSDGALIQQRTLEWLDRYVKGDGSVSTGPQFEWVDQRGQWFSSDVYPATGDAPLVTASSDGGALPLIPYLGGSGVPVIPLAFKAINALNLTVPAASTTNYVVGAPQLTLTYSGTGTGRHVYAQLVDDTTNLVLGTIVTPIPVTLDGQSHTITVDLEPVAHTLAPGKTVTLQLVSAAGLYETVFPSLGTLKVSSMQIALPTVDVATSSSASAVRLMSA